MYWRSMVVALMTVGLCAAGAPAQTLPPDTSAMYAARQLPEAGKAGSLDEEAEFEQPVAGESVVGSENRGRGGAASLWQNGRITCAYDFAYQVGRPARTVVNRPSLRLEWSYLFLDRLFVLFDGKVTAFIADDHRVRAGQEPVRSEGGVREGYVQLSLGQFSLSAGKRILIWGEAEGAAVTDVFSPRDYSELIFVDLEDARLGQWLVQAEWYSPWGTWSCIYNPDPRWNVMPDAGTEYAVEPLPPGSHVEESRPGVRDAEWSLKYRQTFGKSDIVLLAGDLVENQPLYALQRLTAQGVIVWKKSFSRFPVAGATVNFGWGNFLLKGEGAYKWNRTFQDSRGELWESDSADAVVGLEYVPGGTCRISIEASNEHLLNWENPWEGMQQDQTMVTGIWQQTFVNDLLSVLVMLNYQVQYGDVLERAEVAYAFSDTLRGSLRLDYLNIRNARSTFWLYREKPRVGAKVEVRF